MRSYLIDEIQATEIAKVTEFLTENAISTTLEQLFWIKIPDDLLSETQFQHRSCQPHAFAVELGDDWVKMEFLVRSLTNMQCTCPAYATKQQRDFIINFAHSMIEKLEIKT